MIKIGRRPLSNTLLLLVSISILTLVFVNGIIGNKEKNNNNNIEEIFMEDHIDSQNSLKNSLLYGERDQKHLSLDVVGITIFPLYNGNIYPNTTVIMRIETKGTAPDKGILFIDMARLGINISFDLSTDVYYVSEAGKGYLQIDEVNSSGRYNSSSSYWEIDLYIDFSWEFESGGSYNIGCFIVDVFGFDDDYTLKNA